MWGVASVIRGDINACDAEPDPVRDREVYSLADIELPRQQKGYTDRKVKH